MKKPIILDPDRLVCCRRGQTEGKERETAAAAGRETFWSRVCTLSSTLSQKNKNYTVRPPLRTNKYVRK
jgi:hypothetical protein